MRRRDVVIVDGRHSFFFLTCRGGPPSTPTFAAPHSPTAPALEMLSLKPSTLAATSLFTEKPGRCHQARGHESSFGDPRAPLDGRGWRVAGALQEGVRRTRQDFSRTKSLALLLPTDSEFTDISPLTHLTLDCSPSSLPCPPRPPAELLFLSASSAPSSSALLSPAVATLTTAPTFEV